VTLIDTSAWVEYLRATDSPTCRQVQRLIDTSAVAHTTDAVVMEVLAGADDERHALRLRRLLFRCAFVRTIGLADFEQAASMYRRCRRGGETIRALNDCLIGAVAVRAGIEVLAHDRDFAALARHTELRLFTGA
jgi:predicted nucleic acid-binding protein